MQLIKKLLTGKSLIHNFLKPYKIHQLYENVLLLINKKHL